jgi:hypothetical protein
MGGGKPKIPTPEEPAPAHTYRDLEEMEGARKGVRGKKKTGRAANIYAGRMMADRGTEDWGTRRIL